MISIPERFPQWSGYLTVTSTDEVASLVHNVLKDDVVFSLSLAADPGYAPFLTTGRVLDTRPGKGINVAVSPEGDHTKVVVNLQDGDTLVFESSHYLQPDAYRAETDGEDFCHFTFFYDHYDIKGFTFSARHQGRVFQGAVTCQSDDARVSNAYSMMAEEETEESKQHRRAHRDRNFARRQAEESDADKDVLNAYSLMALQDTDEVAKRQGVRGLLRVYYDAKKTREEAEEARQMRDLKLHLLSAHCNAAALGLTDEEALDQHRDEHFGPGGLRSHPFESLHWGRDKALHVLVECCDDDERLINLATKKLDQFINGSD